ncbi:MAG: hypothetical protein ACKVT0_05380 [Planctomycetaceae bacterium]
MPEDLTLFRVTQRTYGYRRYLVQALTWEKAREIVEQSAPEDCEVSRFFDNERVHQIPDVVDDETEYFGPVVFVDSADGRETFFE